METITVEAGDLNRGECNGNIYEFSFINSHIYNSINVENKNEIEFPLSITEPGSLTAKCYIPSKLDINEKFNINCKIIGTDSCPINPPDKEITIGSNPGYRNINGKVFNFANFFKKTTIITITAGKLYKLKFDKENKRYDIVFNNSIIDYEYTLDKEIKFNIIVKINESEENEKISCSFNKETNNIICEIENIESENINIKIIDNPIDDFESLEDKNIGKGTFGSVWKVRHKISKQIFAIKVMNKQNIIQQNMIDQINKEIEIMYKLDHPHIIKLYSHFEDNEDFCLIMEYASNGQLYSLIKKNKKLNQIKAKQYMKEIISAIQYLHTRCPPIIHRDIKPENILIDHEGRCKLADFGWSNFDNGRKNRDTFCGTPEYLAPEMINQSGHDKSVDIWALGILLFEMLTGRIPFNINEDKIQLYNSIKILKINWTDDFPRLAKDLVSKILCINPNERLSLEEILNHQWFRDTPSLRPFLKNINSKEDKQNIHINIIQNNNKNNNNDSNLTKKRLFIKIIKNDENSFKETNISHDINPNNNNIINERYY